jgi:LacI family transcriptional regulator
MNDSAALGRLSAAQRIARSLKERIERREFQPGEWLPTERELAREFSADRSTVRTAIAHLAEQRLIVRENGRRPWINAPAGDVPERSEESGRPSALQTIAAIVPQPPTYPALSAIQRGILHTLHQANSSYRLIVFDNQGEAWPRSVALERHALAAIENDGIAAAVLWHIGGDETLPDIERLQRKGIPLVLLDRLPEGLLCDFVGVDNRAAAREAISYLIRLGHRRIAHLTSAHNILTVREREEGYAEMLLAHGLEPSPDLVYRLEDHDDLYPNVGPAVDHFLSLPEPPTAVFALKDLLAHAFIAEVKARGLRVPEDISVIGFDDHDRHSLQPPVLTTVHQPFDRMGQRAAELLLQRLSSPRLTNTPCQHVMLPAPLVIRSTCQALPKDGPNASVDSKEVGNG